MSAIGRFVTAAARLVTGWLGHEALPVRVLRPAYQRILSRLYRQRGLPWTINGVPCLIDPAARDRLPREYEVGAARFLEARVRPGDTCLDVGANAGAYVIQLAHWSRPNGRVIAFEPNPSAAELLRRHVELNDLTARVEIVQAAVGEKPGNAALHVVGTDGRSRLDQPNPELAGLTQQTSVPVTTIDAFCSARKVKPHWIVVDIEGLEIAALSGARQTLCASPRPCVVVEMHPSVWKVSGVTRARAEALLRDLHATPIPLSGQRDPLAGHGMVYLEPQAGA